MKLVLSRISGNKLMLLKRDEGKASSVSSSGAACSDDDSGDHDHDDHDHDHATSTRLLSTFRIYSEMK
jgi:ABC-type Zn2+ transport system substrate-binding protein/surface adhesin